MTLDRVRPNGHLLAQLEQPGQLWVLHTHRACQEGTISCCLPGLGSECGHPHGYLMAARGHPNPLNPKVFMRS